MCYLGGDGWHGGVCPGEGEVDGPDPDSEGRHAQGGGEGDGGHQECQAARHQQHGRLVAGPVHQ